MKRSNKKVSQYLVHIECDLVFCYKELTVSKNSAPPNENSVHCAPIEGNWNGGDKVLMFIPQLDGRKGSLKFVYNRNFDFRTNRMESLFRLWSKRWATKYSNCSC
jgi:hypothetical protein